MGVNGRAMPEWGMTGMPGGAELNAMAEEVICRKRMEEFMRLQQQHGDGSEVSGPI